jgi:hypothetical protein
MPTETRERVVDPIALLFVFGVGFAAGYGVREWKSRKRRRRYAYSRETEVSGGAVHHLERNKIGRDLAA